MEVRHEPPGQQEMWPFGFPKNGAEYKKRKITKRSSNIQYIGAQMNATNNYSFNFVCALKHLFAQDMGSLLCGFKGC